MGVFLVAAVLGALLGISYQVWALVPVLAALVIGGLVTGLSLYETWLIICTVEAGYIVASFCYSFAMLAGRRAKGEPQKIL